jgi:hypothetical protein
MDTMNISASTEKNSGAGKVKLNLQFCSTLNLKAKNVVISKVSTFMENMLVKDSSR